MSSQRTLVKRRRDAAEETMWTLLLMMEFGALEIDLESRKWLAQEFDKWADLAVETGILRGESEEEKVEREEGEARKTWTPRLGMYVWLNYPDSPHPVGRVVWWNDQGQLVLAQYREEKKLFGEELIPRHTVVMNSHFLLPFPYRSGAWKRAFGED